MASFTDLALSLSQLGSKYLNQIFVITREVRDPTSGQIKIPADYGALGDLLIAQTLVGLALPFAASCSRGSSNCAQLSPAARSA